MSSFMRKVGKCIPFVRSLIEKDEIIEKVEAEAKEYVRTVMAGTDEKKKKRVSEKIRQHLALARGLSPDKVKV